MTSQDEDIFGQIDALLGKRNTAVLAEKTQSGDDFPVLTDVIPTSADSESLGEDDVSVSKMPESTALLDEQNGYRPDSGAPHYSDESLDVSSASLISAIENRLVEMFRLQREGIEESLRIIVREELRRLDETRR